MFGQQIKYEKNKTKRGFEWVEESKMRSTNHSSLPTRSTKTSAGYDFYSNNNYKIMPGESKLIWTDVKAFMQPNEVLLINVRSSMGSRRIMLSNTQGWIDQDYYSNPNNDGNIGINLYNFGEFPYEIKTGDKIAQGVFIKYLTCGDEPETLRIGGFGSTDACK